MIIDSSKNNITTIGDITEFKTGIDPKNLEFITTLLSSNLYSSPEQSFIREIVSNAWDSHVEAGNTDTPVIIKFNDREQYITIRDFGTGISPERFKDIYCNIGSSTKRESNDYIGGFGIGKYSSLACSNVVNIDSYYNGEVRSYIMTKSGNTITTNLINTTQTNEKNGLSISIKNIKNFDNFYKGLRNIVFFPNVYLDTTQYMGYNYYRFDLNKIKIKYGKYFAQCNYRVEDKLLLGNVLYPLNTDKLEYNTRSIISRLSYTGYVIRFNVGELNITPNRENIIYTPSTIQLIETRITQAYDEILKNIGTLINKNYTNIFEYIQLMSKDISYDYITNTINSELNTNSVLLVPISNPKFSITYKGMKLLQDTIDNLKYIIKNRDCHFIKFINCDNRIYTFGESDKKRPYKLESYYKLNNANKIILKNCNKSSSYLKEYLRQNYPEYTFYKEFTSDKVFNFLNQYYTHINKDLIDDLVTQFTNDAEIIDVENDTAFKTYKEEIKNNNKLLNSNIKNIILYSVCYNGISRNREFENIDILIVFFKNKHKGIVLVNCRNPKLSMYRALCAVQDDWELWATTDKVVNVIKSLNLNFLIDIEKELKENTKFRVLASCFVYENILKYKFYKYLFQINGKIGLEYTKLYKLYNSIETYRIVDFRYECNNIIKDEYTINILQKCNEIVEKVDKFKETNNLENDTPDIILYYLYIKYKICHFNFSTYKQIKNNTLIKLLCEK